PERILRLEDRIELRLHVAFAQRALDGYRAGHLPLVLRFEDECSAAPALLRAVEGIVRLLVERLAGRDHIGIVAESGRGADGYLHVVDFVWFRDRGDEALGVEFRFPGAAAAVE